MIRKFPILRKLHFTANTRQRTDLALFQAIQQRSDRLFQRTVHNVIVMGKIIGSIGRFRSPQQDPEIRQGRSEKLCQLYHRFFVPEVYRKSHDIKILRGELPLEVQDLEDGSEDEFQLVGSQEANPMLGRISDDSPIGRGLLGHKKDEVVTVEAPAGTMQFRILSVEND